MNTREEHLSSSRASSNYRTGLDPSRLLYNSFIKFSCYYLLSRYILFLLLFINRDIFYFCSSEEHLSSSRASSNYRTDLDPSQLLYNSFIKFSCYYLLSRYILFLLLFINRDIFYFCSSEEHLSSSRASSNYRTDLDPSRLLYNSFIKFSCYYLLSRYILFLLLFINRDIFYFCSSEEHLSSSRASSNYRTDLDPSRLLYNSFIKFSCYYLLSRYILFLLLFINRDIFYFCSSEEHLSSSRASSNYRTDLDPSRLLYNSFIKFSCYYLLSRYILFLLLFINRDIF